MCDLLSSIFDPNYDFNRGEEAARDAGWFQDMLHDVLPFASEGFTAGYEKGRDDRS